MILPAAARRWRLPVVAVSLLLVLAAHAAADYQAGLDAYGAGDFAGAHGAWRETVNAGPEAGPLVEYREALYGLAMLYWNGEGVEQDFTVSAVWLKQAADINHPGAQTKLGYLYSTGQGVPRNEAAAVRYFEMAARQGDGDARHNLALLQSEAVPAATPAVGGAAPVAPAPAWTPGHDAGEGWVLAQDPAHYTIQVIALSSPEKLQAFIADHPDAGPFAVFRQTRFAEPLWVLVHGAYASVEAARAAKAQFPLGLQPREELWVRRFETIQRLLE